ncbi:MAG: alkaline phosphatase family protein, partial [Anaerolineales bacterium]|nr:alkaline phosphatase family protein [Anaerolineales bacterium]
EYNLSMHFLFLFMDGIGLAAADAERNPFAAAAMPNLQALLGGAALTAESAPRETERATLLALDANLGVDGLPQSATGQAALVTGRNVSAAIGEHYGPKPTKEIAAIIQEDNLFKQLAGRGYRSTLLNAYPQRYFDGIESGKRLLSAIPLAVTSAGIPLMTAEDYYAGRALSVDFTGRGWREQLGYTDAPLMEAPAAGAKVAELTRDYDLAFFEFWPSDYAGHHQDRPGAIVLLENFDAVLGGLLASWKDDEGLILITSDHGNMEDLSVRQHTSNPVPGLVIGAPELRRKFCEGLSDISQITPAILQFYPPG